jgi:hypothetical protein
VIDEELASSFLGKRVLAGITYRSATGEETDKQVHGTITRINLREGVVISLKDGSEFSLPPDLSWYKVAKPGIYTLRATGEEVVDPDLVCTWVVEPPKRH